MVYAGFWSRTRALLIDTAVWIPIFFVTERYLKRSSIALAVGVEIFTGFLAIAYPIYFHGRWGQTIGKMIVRIRVTRLDGTPISYWRAAVRHSIETLFSVVITSGTVIALLKWQGPPLSSLGFIERSRLLGELNPVLGSAYYQWLAGVWTWSEPVVLLLNKRKRALHDFMAGTVVIRVGAKPAAEQSVDSLPYVAAPRTLPDGTVCTHEGETANYCTRCWSRPKPA